MKKKCCEINEGKTDRVLRLILAIIFLYLGYAASAWFYLLALIAIVTAITGFCGLYALFGIKTSRKHKPIKKKNKSKK